MTDMPQFAPGCFGSALAFKSKDQICRQCVFRTDCEPVHLKSLQSLRDKYGITAKVPKPSLEEEDTYPELSAKIVQVIERLKRMDIDFASLFKSGKNPFAGRKMMPFEFVCHAALTRPEMILTQRGLAVYFAEKLNWAPNTAAAQTRVICKSLEYFKIVRCDGDKVISMLADNG